ncbi:MAG: endonuclease III [Desulfobacterales bacterium]|nr:endonuclease III [Deltaproteobacteria bacterium]MBT8359995.1 endonuclease III [Deltaproteobacteria bacterium]NNK92761.1 endonuclease III [Desulfobacterales bacterium]
MLIDIEKFLTILEQEVKGYRVPVVDLIGVQTANPYRILMATILSARTKDEVTAAASERLFSRAPDVYHLVRLNVSELQKIIFPVGFYKVKASHLMGTAQMLVELHGGKVPDTIEELIKLPGVGRKTANLVLSVAFDIPAICVDTHVHRIMNIWGCVSTKTPYETEMRLRKKLPRSCWKKINSLLVAFGQGRCKPVAPHCDQCILFEECPQIGVIPRKI